MRQAVTEALTVAPPSRFSLRELVRTPEDAEIVYWLAGAALFLVLAVVVLRKA